MDTPARQLSQFVDGEKIVSAVGALIARQTAVRLQIPLPLNHRAVYVFLEAIPSVLGEDFELDAQVVFWRNGALLHTIPASIADNSSGSGLVQRSKITAFANVASGANENLYAQLGAPLTNGLTDTSLSPQKLQIEADEVSLEILGSRNTGNSFSGWRALLAVRSSLVSL